MDSSEPQTITLRFHHEDGSWWADSPNLPSLFAGGDTLEEAQQLARQIVSDELGDDVTTVEWMPVPEPLWQVVTGWSRPVGDAEIREWNNLPERRVDLQGAHGSAAG